MIVMKALYKQQFFFSHFEIFFLFVWQQFFVHWIATSFLMRNIRTIYMQGFKMNNNKNILEEVLLHPKGKNIDYSISALVYEPWSLETINFCIKRETRHCTVQEKFWNTLIANSIFSRVGIYYITSSAQ